MLPWVSPRWLVLQRKLYGLTFWSILKPGNKFVRQFVKQQMGYLKKEKIAKEKIAEEKNEELKKANIGQIRIL